MIEVVVDIIDQTNIDDRYSTHHSLDVVVVTSAFGQLATAISSSRSRLLRSASAAAVDAVDVDVDVDVDEAGVGTVAFSSTFASGEEREQDDRLVISMIVVPTTTQNTNGRNAMHTSLAAAPTVTSLNGMLAGDA